MTTVAILTVGNGFNQGIAVEDIVQFLFLLAMHLNPIIMDILLVLATAAHQNDHNHDNTTGDHNNRCHNAYDDANHGLLVT